MIKIGKIVNCHGHKGELKIFPLTDNLKRFKGLKEAYLEKANGQYELVNLVSTREHKGNVLVVLEHINDMNAAEKLKNLYVCVKKEDAVKLPKNHYFIYELIGLDVVEDDQVIGQISEVLQTGSNDVYVVKNNEGLIYMPALKSVVHNIDLDNKKMTVTLPDGLLD